ncbi:hypothetical protein LCGC14_0329790 [marine sediment metagenome]|uniref:Uncharacterized protein n=1 Tax=marine sediment metagenome TaxID=412755 RepID=A0A0F9W407_9ZZZZ
MAIGMIAGAIAGAGTEALASREESKRRQAARPKNRRLNKVMGTLQQGMNNRQRALMAVAQAHANYASMV